MSHEGNTFDEAILTELNAALDSLTARLTENPPADREDQAGATLTLRVLTSIDLLRRRCRLLFALSDARVTDKSVKDKYRLIAAGISDLFSAWGDAPPQFAQFCVPEDVYEKLYPIYAKARDRAGRPQ